MYILRPPSLLGSFFIIVIKLCKAQIFYLLLLTGVIFDLYQSLEDIRNGTPFQEKHVNVLQ